MKRIRRTVAIALALGIILRADIGLAQESNNILDGIVDLYQQTANSWRQPILDAANRLFWLLVGIDFIWTGINLGLEKADLSRIVSELIKRIMVIGFYYALLINSGTWSSAIIDSFRGLAGAANSSASGLSGDISPSNIFDIGLRIAGELSDQVTFSDIGESIGRVIISIFILISFAFVAGLLLVALIELYIALNAAVLLLAFGGSRWTQDYAIKYMTFIFAVGMKIFVMQLLIGIGQSFVLTMNQNYKGDMTQSLVLLGVSIVLCMIVKTIPDYLQSIVSGVAPGSAGNSLMSAASAAGGAALGAATGGAAIGVGGTLAVMEAAKLAGSQATAGISSQILGAAKHLGGAALGDIGGKMSGNLAHQHGNMGARMASRLKEERLSRVEPGAESTKEKKDP
ncbi:MAG: P-type conjugative transfer protein TrbL [Proteobacteria bacterium]|nr:P-type conjugative transfer protein TrbL [Pseudomonadota bacterium]